MRPIRSPHAPQIHILRTALTYNPGLPGDYARAERVYDWALDYWTLITNVLQSPSAAHELMEFAMLQPYKHRRVVPTTSEVEARLAAIYFGTIPGGEQMLLHDLAAMPPIDTPVELPVAQAALDIIIDRLTYSPENPDGPIYRTRSGKFLPGAYSPYVSGTPTERLVWLGLYHRHLPDGPTSKAPIRHLAEELGCSLQSTVTAVRSLERRGIVNDLYDAPHPSYVMLSAIYTAAAADERVAWQAAQSKRGGTQ
jgi:hypothetical protein